MWKVRQLKGKKFGRLTVLRLLRKRGKAGHARWECFCVCGSKKIVDGTNLTMGWTKSCGCLAREARRLRPYESIYNAIQRSAKRRNLEFKLSYAEFLTFTKSNRCHYCHCLIVWKKFHQQGSINGQGYNLDRKNNSVGYLKNNLVPCCKRCNAGKRDLFGYKEWHGMTKFFRSRECRKRRYRI
jgi:hypothetical protein